VPGRRPLVAGAAAFGVAIALYAVYAAIHPTQWTLNPVDLAVYRSGGLIVRHIRPVFDPRAHAPLYDWAGYGSLGLKFTYTPFAAIVFAVVSFIPWSVLPKLSMGVNIVALVAALWFTFGGLGYRNRPRVRLGATLLASAAVFWTEPVVRTLYLGQVNLVLMALILWDLCQPDTKASRWWKGAGVGIAAGIKLVPLVFIPYLLFARKFRQAAMASAAFVFTVLLGFVIQGPDSSKWWFGGLFFQGGRTGFTGWEGNQSLRGLLTRLAGSISGAQAGWILAAVLIGITGIACAAILDRAGHQVAGLLAAALTGLLLSPISWDHHWVWTAPAVAVAGHYAVRSWRSSRVRAWAWWALAGAILAVYGAWPGSLWGEPTDLGAFSLGILWQPPNTDPATYYQHGDQPWFVEYHWHGLQLVTGNAFILGGLALFVVILAATVRVAVRARAGQPLGSLDKDGDRGQDADGGAASRAPGEPAEPARPAGPGVAGTADPGRARADPSGTSEPSRALCSRRGYPELPRARKVSCAAPHRRSVPIMSGACCGPSACCGRARSSRLASCPLRTCGRSRTTRSPRPCGCRKTPACARRPTVSSAGRPGTWTSSTPSAVSPRPRATSPCGSGTHPARSSTRPRRCGSRVGSTFRRRSSRTRSPTCSRR
jgi:alpha-1,2-mannosyltransferase